MDKALWTAFTWRDVRTREHYERWANLSGGFAWDTTDRLAALDAYKAECRGIDARLGLPELRTRQAEASAKDDAACEKLLGTRSRTLQGVVAKLDALYGSEIEQMQKGLDAGFDMRPEWTLSIYCDLERLSGGLPS